MPTVTIQQAFELARQHHHAGRLADAEVLYRQILTADPKHSGAWHFLGVLAYQAGRHDFAVAWIQHAIVLNPMDPAAHSDLGEVYRTMGRTDEAVARFRHALQLRPNDSGVQSNLGNALMDQGHLDEAVIAYLRSLEIRSDLAEVHNNLGNALTRQGRLPEAVSAYHRALEIRPTYAEAQYNLGYALREQGRLDEAVVAYQTAIYFQPNQPVFHNDLGNVLSERGHLDQAAAAYRRAIQLKPDYPEAHFHLGTVLTKQGFHDEATAAYRRALEFRPHYPEACLHLGNTLTEKCQFDEAIAAYREALALRPDYPAARTSMGVALAEQGLLDEAVSAFRSVLQEHPDNSGAHSNLVYTLHFHPQYDHRAITEEHRRWNQHFAEPLRSLHRPHGNDRDPGRRLRIGYVSPNFYRHPISYFVLPLLEAHDKTQVEVFCYASVQRPDDYTPRVKKTADVWCDALSLGDDALSERIRADEIDILVDLTQHMAGNRMLMFARKPAPLQVSWLGYPGTTGLPAMDYRFTDSLMEPEGSAWSESVETPIRLPDSWFCFEPIEDLEVVGLPAGDAGQVTFGSLNNFGKVNEGVLRLWVKVLRIVDGSRLLLHCPAGTTQARLLQWFEAQGIASHRLELVPRTATRMDYLRLFHQIDIALDPFPYNGGTTTCDALWMGVPVVSLAGRTAVSRLGLSVLTTMGLPELVADGEDEYVRIAAELAKDRPRLTELRGTLRARMRASPLMDAPRFARNIETAYRTMWQQWCGKNPSGA